MIHNLATLSHAYSTDIFKRYLYLGDPLLCYRRCLSCPSSPSAHSGSFPSRCPDSRVGHRVLFHSERSVLSRSFKERNVLFRSFFEFLATYETQKNDAFFSILFLRTEKNAKNATFFCKERKRTRERFVLLQKKAEHCVLFFNIYIYSRYI